MTRDFIDQLAAACDQEGCAYVIIVSTPSTENVFVKRDLTNWTPADGRTVADELREHIDMIERWENED